MFSRLLIANRGEIACRIARTCRRMGIESVAVYSEPDAEALHVRMADRAVALGGRTPAESYLRGEAIIAAALAEGAEAIHPGYGFLSENAEFAEAVAAAGLIFIGPSAEAIRAMGLKDAAKRLMAEAGVPVVPGYHGENQHPEHLAGAADGIGYPVLIKAVAGGGGKGMRRVDRAEDFAEALASARAEAEAAFGNGDVLVEKYIRTPRHIEMQVFGDGIRAVHLYERDCSLQRRHQKVLEEAPAPGMTADMRAAMGAAAVRAAEAIGYRGAGTVEFIVDAAGGLEPDGFWFMEMNTRLQVEHPVTEAVTGLDLVEWQLCVAAGEALPLSQDEVTLSGHAVEVRLYAEDPGNDFLPETGRLDHLAFPEGVRVESGVEAGDVISPYYDPMIAKLIATGADRAEALGALSRALGATQVAGAVTNLRFLKTLVDDPDVRAGAVETGLIAAKQAALTAMPEPAPEVLAQAALAAAGLWEEAPALAGFALWAPLRFPVGIGEEMVLLEAAEGGWDISVSAAMVRAERGARGWRLNGRAGVPFVRHGDRITLFDGGACELRLPDPLDRASQTAGGDAVLAPMPGLVSGVAVAPGAAVAEGDRLVVLEAMKMEHVLRAPRDGVVEAVGVAEGAQVEAGAVLIRLAERGMEDTA